MISIYYASHEMPKNKNGAHNTHLLRRPVLPRVTGDDFDVHACVKVVCGWRGVVRCSAVQCGSYDDHTCFQ